MMLTPCPYEIEVRDLAMHGQWPASAAPELRAHVAACRSCADLVLVADAFQKARAGTIAAAKPIAPGVLLWRAQLRRRNAVVERLTRPLLGAQIFALAFTLAIGVGFLIFEALRTDAWRTWLQDLPQSAVLQWDNWLVAAAANPAWTWIMLGPALLLLAGVAVYKVTDRQ